MASVAAQSAYSTDIIAVQRVFYDEIYSFLCKYQTQNILRWDTLFTRDHIIVQWMLTVSTQLIGLSLGGIMHRFLVAPPSMSKLLFQVVSNAFPPFLVLVLPLADLAIHPSSMAKYLGPMRTLEHSAFSTIRWI